ncbi:hypothetical protein C6H64_01475 [Photorhabdus luminescens]|nr:hypothetical protein C6H64_01475 [Photorhabdus luminescens]
MTEEHNQIADTDDELIRTTFHIDDGRDYTQRIIRRMKRNFYIHEGKCPPLTPAPQVVNGEPGTDIVQLHSGEFVGTGVMVNYCPFCGQDIDTVSHQRKSDHEQ